MQLEQTIKHQLTNPACYIGKIFHEQQMAYVCSVSADVIPIETWLSFHIGPDRACKVRAQVGLVLYTAVSGFCRPGLAWWEGSWSGLWA
jgi:hypothetical protein